MNTLIAISSGRHRSQDSLPCWMSSVRQCGMLLGPIGCPHCVARRRPAAARVGHSIRRRCIPHCRPECAGADAELGLFGRFLSLRYFCRLGDSGAPTHMGDEPVPPFASVVQVQYGVNSCASRSDFTPLCHLARAAVACRVFSRAANWWAFKQRRWSRAPPSSLCERVPLRLGGANHCLDIARVLRPSGMLVRRRSSPSSTGLAPRPSSQGMLW